MNITLQQAEDCDKILQWLCDNNYKIFDRNTIAFQFGLEKDYASDLITIIIEKFYTKVQINNKAELPMIYCKEGITQKFIRDGGVRQYVIDLKNENNQAKRAQDLEDRNLVLSNRIAELEIPKSKYYYLIEVGKIIAGAIVGYFIGKIT
jgi:hypothetical protein